jgi:hypothetical protein
MKGAWFRESGSAGLLWLPLRALAATSTFVAGLCMSGALVGQSSTESEFPSGFLTRTITYEGREHPYLLYVPTAIREGQLVVCLHDVDKRGADGLLPMSAGLGNAIVRRLTDWPYLTVFPQLHPSMQSWESMRLAVDRIVQDVAGRSKVDSAPLKIVGTGMGLGAEGIVYFASKEPDRWSGVLAVGCSEDGIAKMVGKLRCPIMFLETGREPNGVLHAALAAQSTTTGGQFAAAFHMPGASHTRAYEDSRSVMWLDLASTNPCLAFSLVDSRVIKSYDLSLVAEDYVDTRDGIGLTEVHLRYADRSWQWSVQDKNGARTGKMAGAGADEWVRLMGMTVYDTGIMRMPGKQVPRPIEGVMLDDVSMAIRWHLTTELGSWDFTSELPLKSQCDARLRPVLRGLQDCQAMMIRQLR